MHDVKIVFLWICIAVLIMCMLFVVNYFGKLTTSQLEFVKKLPIQQKANMVCAGGIFAVIIFVIGGVVGVLVI